MIGALTNHVWQSTVFALVMGVLTVAFRQNRARVRYGLWLSASLKFFIPFALLIGLGSRLPAIPAAQQMATSSVSSTIVQISQPFTDALPAVPTPSTVHTRDWPLAAVVGLWLCGLIAIVVLRWRGWQRIRAAVHASSALKIPGMEMPAGVRLHSTPGLAEPGVVGWRHPILLVPQDIADHLTPSQLEPVLAHELCHVRRRDNLTAAIHMVVESLFWFHPLVWWIGARLVDERERACDEDVLRIFGTPQAYAEGILRVCTRYVETPLICVSGVGGSNLRKRIEAIMANRVGIRLNMPRRLILAGAALTTVTLPLAVGAMPLPQTSAQTVVGSASAAKPLAFEVASIKLNKSGSSFRSSIGGSGERWAMTNVSIAGLIVTAYQTPPTLSDLPGAPDWVRSERYDIDARATFVPTKEQERTMLRGLLAERFKFIAHYETQERPIYNLVIARADGRLGPQIRHIDIDCASYKPDPNAAPPTATDDVPPCVYKMLGQDTLKIISGGRTMQALADSISLDAGRPIFDKTGLTGYYAFTLEDGAFNPNGLSIFTALQEQLGLKLESTKGPVDSLVIDHVERPTPD